MSDFKGLEVECWKFGLEIDVESCSDDGHCAEEYKENKQTVTEEPTTAASGTAITIFPSILGAAIRWRKGFPLRWRFQMLRKCSARCTGCYINITWRLWKHAISTPTGSWQWWRRNSGHLLDFFRSVNYTNKNKKLIGVSTKIRNQKPDL